MEKKRNILEVVRLVRVLDDDAISDVDKIEQIKMVRDNGDITSDEAFELCLDHIWKPRVN